MKSEGSSVQARAPKKSSGETETILLHVFRYFRANEPLTI